MEEINKFFNETFSSLKIKNYRLYFIGQVISVSGTFMQSVAQAWLVLKLTNSGTALGVVTALQFLPSLILGPWGGVIADRFDKRKLLYITQSVFGILGLILGILIVFNIVKLWMVILLAIGFGLVNVVDSPARQAFVMEMVGEGEIRNAVTLYTTLVNLARVIGPLLAGVLISTVGLAPCFILNGLSYIAVLIMLFIMDEKFLYRAPIIQKTKGQLREGIKYILKTPILRDTLLIMAIIGTLTYEFQVSLPLIAQNSFHGDATTYAWLTAALGLGSVMGGFIIAARKETSINLLMSVSFLFGVSTLIAAFMPNFILSMLLIIVVGFFSIYFISLGNSILQLETEAQMRGRVMAFWSVAFLGSTAIGGPIVGWIGENIGARISLGFGGVAAIIAAGIGYLLIKNYHIENKNLNIDNSQIESGVKIQ